MDVVKLVEVGEKLGFSGTELQNFVREEQNKAREDRVQQLEIRRQERENSELQLKIETERRAQSEQTKASTANVAGRQKAKSPKLPPFCDTRDNIDSYLQRFERYAQTQSWPTEDWAISLSALLTGKALDVYTRLPLTDLNNYDKLKLALLKRFQLTADGFHNKFFSAKPEAGETGHQYAARLENYFDRWIALSGINQSFKELKDILLREQYMDSCHRDLTLFLKERQPKSMSDTTNLADQYLDARGGSFKAPTPRPPSHPPSQRNYQGNPPPTNRQDDGKSFSNPSFPQRRETIRTCYKCHQEGHLANNCPKSLNRNRPTCFLCHKVGHVAKDCTNTSFKTAGLTTSNDSPHVDESQPDNPPEPTSLQSQSEHSCTCQIYNPNIELSCMMVKSPPEVESQFEKGKDSVTLPSGHSVPLMSAACNIDDIKIRKMPVTTGLVGNNEVTVLRDSGCSGTVIREDIVHPNQLTGKEVTCFLIDGTVRKFPTAVIDVDTPYFKGRVQAICMINPLYDLIIGNIPGVRAPDNPDLTWSNSSHRSCAVQSGPQTTKQGYTIYTH